MASYSDIAHRWANQDFGQKGSLVAGNCSCNEYNFKSYNTVIGQWLDKEKNVMALIDVGLSNSTSKHVSALSSAIPGRVHVFRLHKPSCWGQWQNVDFIDRHTPFDKKVRMSMVNIFIDNLYEAYSTIKTSRALKDGKISKLCWSYIKELNELYNHDASPKKWLKQKLSDKLSKSERATIMLKRRMVRGLLEGMSDSQIVDLMYGQGTWAAWEERTAPLRKSEHARKFAEKVNEYLGAYQRWGRKPVYTYKEIQAMTPSQRIAIKFANFEKRQVKYKKQLEHREQSMDRAKRYIGIVSPNRYGSNEDVAEVINHFTGEKIYFMERSSYCYDYHENVRITFGVKEFKAFCEASDKKHWLKRFYDMCTVKRNRIIAMNLYDQIKNGRLSIEELTPSEIALYDGYLKRKEQYEKDDELRRAKEAEERAARLAEIEARKRAEREEKLQKLAAYRENGMEGLRNIWRDHFDAIPSECRNDDEYYYGGNVLLRFENEDIVGTSKGIKLSIKLCKVLFRTIKKWHDDPVQFSQTEVRTENCGIFRITEYKDDILVAGCHRIAYTEMERMYNAIMNKQVA